jgi:hypothetical protein
MEMRAMTKRVAKLTADQQRARDFVRSVLTDTFGQKADSRTVNAVARKALRALPTKKKREGEKAVA